MISKTTEFAMSEKQAALAAFRKDLQTYINMLESQPETIDGMILAVISEEEDTLKTAGVCVGSPIRLAQLYEALGEHPELLLGTMQLKLARRAKELRDNLDEENNPEVMH